MGSPYDERRHAIARRAYRMQQKGLTAREIAGAIGCRPEQVKSRVLLGERLLDAEHGSAPLPSPKQKE